MTKIKKYIQVTDGDKILYFKIPQTLLKHQFKNYCTKGTKRSPRYYLKGLFHLYEENIEFLETDKDFPITPYNESFKTPKLRNEGFIEHNLITGENTVTFDEDNRMYVNQNCIKDQFLYYSRKEYYENPQTKINIERIKANYVQSFLRDNINNIVEMQMAENEDGKPYMMVKLINN